MYFHRQFTEVLLGDHSKAATHPGHALLLVWPFSDEEAKSPWARDVEPWDVRALRLYTLGKSADFQPTKSSWPRNTLRARSKASQGRSMT